MVLLVFNFVGIVNSYTKRKVFYKRWHEDKGKFELILVCDIYVCSQYEIEFGIVICKFCIISKEFVQVIWACRSFIWFRKGLPKFFVIKTVYCWFLIFVSYLNSQWTIQWFTEYVYYTVAIICIVVDTSDCPNSGMYWNRNTWRSFLIIYNFRILTLLQMQLLPLRCKWSFSLPPLSFPSHLVLLSFEWLPLSPKIAYGDIKCSYLF